MEIWKKIDGYENIYEISDKGNVKSIARFGTIGGIIKPFLEMDMLGLNYLRMEKKKYTLFIF